MHARVWQVAVAPENVDQFAEGCRAVGALNRRHSGFRGLIVVRGGPRDAPECSVVSVWDSLEALRASESESFEKAVARVLACCKAGAALQEEDVLICDFPPARKPQVRPAKSKRVKTKRRRRVKRGA